MNSVKIVLYYDDFACLKTIHKIHNFICFMMSYIVIQWPKINRILDKMCRIHKKKMLGFRTNSSQLFKISIQQCYIAQHRLTYFTKLL